ncbi:3-phosphoshikimate 1-carboxyvinyltransferase [uncultured Phascolarctobacterium sp.]|mgnify:CR=1 FL=1|uniref:3-phosphoshikimate 1-carboxyvinyltransferase n=1 Tax=uncultured Phascolarctobacterium sp. TaxID=512296 RepID=UPI0025EF606D|nr:3-phosphoshikimate 1-carboxyvinyltransferase [uncultured Phascolarctobacterium sp.]
MDLNKLTQDATVKIYPAKLQGTVQAPSSKSMGHREIICAGLAAGTSIVDNISMSKDIEATMRCLKALDVAVDEIPSMLPGRKALQITGTGRPAAAADSVDCGESGSTLRFFIPLGATLNCPLTFMGHGKLVSRPLQAYYDIFDEQLIQYFTDGGNLPLTVNGRLRPGIFKLPGNVSSQFVSGLLFALPLLDGDSVIEITSPLESAAYVDMTLQCLAKYGVSVNNENGAHRRYLMSGKQRYRAQNSRVEGDWSQAAFWLAGGSLGSEVVCSGVDFASLQGDKAVVGIMERMGANIACGENAVTVSGGVTQATVIDAANCPDIIPVLTAAAAVSEGITKIINAARLRIKECDRLAAMTSELSKMGAQIVEEDEGLTVYGQPSGLIGGVDVDAWNDHRIAMSLAIAAQRCRLPIVLHGAGSVSKSYPTFWTDYCALGGKIEVLA